MLFQFVKEAQWSYLVVHIINHYYFVLDWIASVCYQQQRIKWSSDDVTYLHNISWLVSWISLCVFNFQCVCIYLWIYQWPSEYKGFILTCTYLLIMCEDTCVFYLYFHSIFIYIFLKFNNRQFKTYHLNPWPWKHTCRRLDLEDRTRT